MVAWSLCYLRNERVAGPEFKLRSPGCLALKCMGHGGHTDLGLNPGCRTF